MTIFTNHKNTTTGSGFSEEDKNNIKLIAENVIRKEISTIRSELIQYISLIFVTITFITINLGLVLKVESLAQALILISFETLLIIAFFTAVYKIILQSSESEVNRKMTYSLIPIIISILIGIIILKFAPEIDIKFDMCQEQKMQ